MQFTPGAGAAHNAPSPSAANRPPDPSASVKINPGFVAILAFVAIIGITSCCAILHLINNAQWVAHTRDVARAISDLAGSFTDAETSERGYVITGRLSYLDPYQTALRTESRSQASLRTLTADNPRQQANLDRLAGIARDKLADMQNVIDTRRTGDPALAQARVINGIGQHLMDKIRAITADMSAEEDRLGQIRTASLGRSAQASIIAVLVSSLLAAVLLVILIRLDIKSRCLAAQLTGRMTVQLDEHALELEATNKELESFCYSVSHDLRAPLRTISGFADALREDCAAQLPKEGKDHLARICAATSRMSQLIDDMLNLSRVTRAEMQRTPVDLAPLAQSVMRDLTRAEPSRHVEFVQSAGLQAVGGTQLIRVVLDNLLGNAWKFTSRKPDARIEFGTTSDPGGRAFFVRDNGAGFDMKYAGKLFGAFQRLHAMTEFPGTGVGLATVQRIVHRHGGRVWADAHLGQGATFYFTLPDEPQRTAA